ncbi:MAG: hypothetical protein RMA76_17555 [Deltaproteobacteria bacterium]
MAGSIFSTLHRLALGLGLLAGLGLVAPEIAFADRPTAGQCKRKKQKKRRKARRARRARARRAKAFNARTIKKLQRKGYTNDEIVEKARAANYVVTKKQKRRLKKMRVRRSLIAALATPAPAKAVAPAKPQPIDLDRTIDPNEIDFDSVPPPDGMPTGYAVKPKPAEKKKLDTSLRPSAPFVPKKAATQEKKPIRKVLTASN